MEAIFFGRYKNIGIFYYVQGLFNVILNTTTMIQISIFILVVFFISGHAFFPVVYVIFGEIPMFLKINIELAARNNPVVVLTDSRNDIGKNFSLFGIQYVNVHDYSKAANDFAPHYKHMSRDHSPGRQHHELRCIQRWFILKEYMGKNNVERAFFGDGDSSVFVNISEIFNLRPQCGSVINVEAQGQVIILLYALIFCNRRIKLQQLEQYLNDI